MNINSISFKLTFYLCTITITLTNGNTSKHQPLVEYYNIKDDQYVFFSQKLTWDEASIVCLAHNGKLAILDTLEKATNVAKAMADSNIDMRDAWIAGRRFEITWFWTDNSNHFSTGSIIPLDPGIEKFPPWTREPTRKEKECLALDRFSHADPSFLDLECRLPKPFICQKKTQDSLNTPVPSKRIRIGKSVYILYHGQITWVEAVTFCRLQGTRLAVIKNINALNIITFNMIKSRPDFENVWIGAHYAYGRWVWLSTGSEVSSIRDKSGYPPWRSGKSEKKSGCLLLDIHLGRNADFIEVPCDRKRDFVCEEYPPEEAVEWENKPVKFTYQKEIFAIYPIEKTWDESRVYCQNIGGSLGYANNLELALNLVFEMGDHPKDISHLWLGGIYRSNVSEWRWIHNNEVVPLKANLNSQLWADTLMEAETSSEELLCLNLDKTDHGNPHIYGLDCESKQPFVCISDCKRPPTVTKGEWKCVEDSDTQTCTLECANSYYLMGLNKAKCSDDIGWYNNDNEELNLPLCLNMSDYVQRVVRSLSQDILRSSGYYILLSHVNNIIRNRSFEFSEKLLNVFPLSKYLKMGMLSTFTNPPSNIPFEQNDTCTALNFMNAVKHGDQSNRSEPKQFLDWTKEVTKNKKEKSVIVAILDSDSAEENQEAIEQLKLQGHFVIVIGFKTDWEKLLPLATIGFEERINLYLFDEQEYALFIDEFNKLKNKSQKECSGSSENKRMKITTSTSDIKESQKKGNETEKGIMQEKAESEAMEETDVSDAVEETNVRGAMEETDVSDAVEETNVRGAMEETDVSDAVEETNVSGAMEETDVSDAIEETEVSDVIKEVQVVDSNSSLQVDLTGQDVSAKLNNTESNQETGSSEDVDNGNSAD